MNNSIREPDKSAKTALANFESWKLAITSKRSSDAF